MQIVEYFTHKSITTHNLKMNEFLFHLENGLEEAISKSGGVELYAI